MVGARNQKADMEQEILKLYEEISVIQDKESLEYKKLCQKIYTPIWRWTLLTFDENDVCSAGIEIFHCIKRTLVKYTNDSDTSYTGFLYSCLNNEIRHKKEKGEVINFRMCTKEDYNRAVRLIRTVQRTGKNPNSEKVQIWLAKQALLPLEEVQDLIKKYYQSQLVDEQIYNPENDETESIFDCDSVKNRYLTPEDFLFRVEDITEDLKVIEGVFNACQERQKVYLSIFITFRVLQILERNLLYEQIIELLQPRNFLDQDLFSVFLSDAKMPSQKELADKIGKDEGYISNRISEFFEKVKNKISTEYVTGTTKQ